MWRGKWRDCRMRTEREGEINQHQICIAIPSQVFGYVLGNYQETSARIYTKPGPILSAPTIKEKPYKLYLNDQDRDKQTTAGPNLCFKLDLLEHRHIQMTDLIGNESRWSSNQNYYLSSSSQKKIANNPSIKLLKALSLMQKYNRKCCCGLTY